MIRLIIVVFLFVFSTFALSSQSEKVQWPEDFHNPFWRKKIEVQKRMQNEDLIVVSAKTEKIRNDPKLYEMRVVAGGDVDVPQDFAFEQISNYEDLKKADNHFVEVHYNKDQKKVEIGIEALGYRADMVIRVFEVERKTPQGKSREIHWLCVEKQFKGMKGVFQVLEIGRQKSEISMTAEYSAEKLPLPKVLMGFGLEVIGRQVANQLKRYIVQKYHER